MSSSINVWQDVSECAADLMWMSSQAILLLHLLKTVLLSVNTAGTPWAKQNFCVFAYLHFFIDSFSAPTQGKNSGISAPVIFGKVRWCYRSEEFKAQIYEAQPELLESVKEDILY